MQYCHAGRNPNMKADGKTNIPINKIKLGQNPYSVPIAYPRISIHTGTTTRRYQFGKLILVIS